MSNNSQPKFVEINISKTTRKSGININETYLCIIYDQFVFGKFIYDWDSETIYDERVLYFESFESDVIRYDPTDSYKWRRIWCLSNASCLLEQSATWAKLHA